MNCGKCGREIKRRRQGYELCPSCYEEALENQRLFWKELAEWARQNKLYVAKVTLTGQ